MHNAQMILSTGKLVGKLHRAILSQIQGLLMGWGGVCPIHYQLSRKVCDCIRFTNIL